ncbi:translesion DNA synthesis-associated protein ImuA [Halomonas huangheensis]|uniref:SOS cell division inhibitor SulA n=1 Tax=Halomonas huangheensis TaxID=1178482 RepID=W1NBZ2_9GAMM|nr:translesion DNA synthesis-associated protein ImuA [Halomonas huangheensis]ALM53010.1 hypothetical protein AR456_12475 [Halomonas huangheensis]ERL53059.1 hypothetical protein BJB45_17435 [Halomonas huangheensis]
MGLDHLINRGDVWRGPRALRSSDSEVLSTGDSTLDSALHGGWPRAELVELLHDQPGIGELQLMLSLLADREHSGWLVWVDPPCLPYAPALQHLGVSLEGLMIVRTRNVKERLWAMEQALRSGCCRVVLGWVPVANPTALRRLQLAVSEGGNWGVVIRPGRFRQHSSPAPWRLLLEPEANGEALGVTPFKRKGGWALPRLRVSLGQRPWLPPVGAARVADREIRQAGAEGQPELRLVERRR